MKKHYKAYRIASLAVTAVLLFSFLGISVNADTTPNKPYNISFQIGTDASQVCFNWFSLYDKESELQIAKASDIKDGNFTPNSSLKGSIRQVTATVSVADNPGNPNNQTTDSATGMNEYVNRVTVDALAPSTKYVYRVGDGTTWSDNYTFTTGDPKNGFSFAAFGDPQIGSFDSNKHSSAPHANLTDDRNGWADTLKKVVSKYPSINFLFTMGDQVNNYDDLTKHQEEYKSFFNPDPAKSYIQEYPLVTLEGNHDLQMGTYYSLHFNEPNLSKLGQTQNSNVDNNDGDYWFTYGNVLFMVLNANSPLDTAAHDQFMQQAVTANPNVKWKVAAWHQSAYSEASHSDSKAADDPIMSIRQNWPKLMDKYGVDVVLQGHDHSYTRTYQMYNGVPVSSTKTNSVTNPKGTVYFTLDSGSGSKFYDFKTSSDHTFSSVFWQQYVATYSYITMDDSKFTINTIRTDTGASIDNYSITKTSAGASLEGSVSSSPNQTFNPKTGDNSSNGILLSTLAAVFAFLVLTLLVIIARRKKLKTQ